MTVPVREYLEDAFRFTEEEERLCAEATEWLPPFIIDAHAHSNLERHVLRLTERQLGHMHTTFPWFTLENSYAMQERFFPGRRVQTLRFSTPYYGIDHRDANRYLLENCLLTDRVAAVGIPTDPTYTVHLLKDPRVVALKIYYAYSEEPVKTIYEHFTPEILEETQALNIPIILHLPDLITRSAGDLRRVIADFPRLQIVLAHLGLPKMMVDGLEEAYAEFQHYDTVFMDNSMNPSKEVTASALRHFGSSRIMYGTDQPMNLVRVRAYYHPELGQRYATYYPYHWVDELEQAQPFVAEIGAKAVHAHWKVLLALRQAVAEVFPNDRERVLGQVMHDNAKELYQF